MTLTELLRADPPVLERVTVQLTRGQFRAGVDLAAVRLPSADFETTLVSPQLVCHQIWRGARLDVDPLRSSDVSLLSDSFRLEVNPGPGRRLLVDESLHLASNAWRAAKFRYFPELVYIRAGDVMSAFVKGPGAEAVKTRVQLEIYGWEVTDEIAKIIEARGLTAALKKAPLSEAL